MLAPNKEAAFAAAEKLSKLPEVAAVKTIESFIPADQKSKLAAIRKLGEILNPVLKPDPSKTPPTDADNVAALKAAVTNVRQAADNGPDKDGPGVVRRAASRSRSRRSPMATRRCAHACQAAMIAPLDTALDELRDYLQAQPVTLETLPPEIADNWITKTAAPRSRYCRRAIPTTTRRCANSPPRCRPRSPTRIGGPISILELGRTMIKSFFEAGFWALGSITILLWIVLRRFGDVLLTLIPLLPRRRGDDGADGDLRHAV